MEYTAEQLAGLKEAEKQIFISFIDVCEKLNLRYYLVEGTLLGAVRHKGFIPWDDDIDVAMPRKDYEIFLKEAQKLLPEHLFVQSIWTDPAYLQCFAKIRNSNTTFLETTAAKHPINHGVFIDIFPLDYYPQEPEAQQRLNKLRKLYTARVSSRYASRRTLKGRLMKLALTVRYPSYRKVLIKRDELLKSVPENDMVTNYGSAWENREIVPESWYGQPVKLSFEGLQVNAPAQYDKLLTQIYGDYMTPPPAQKRVGHHYTDVIDLERPYTEYFGK